MNTIERLEKLAAEVALCDRDYKEFDRLKDYEGRRCAVLHGVIARDNLMREIEEHIPALLAVAKAADHLNYVWIMRASDLIHHSNSSKTFDRTSQANAELKLTQALAALKEGK